MIVVKMVIVMTGNGGDSGHSSSVHNDAGWAMVKMVTDE
jgi:hypothetical protein